MTNEEDNSPLKDQAILRMRLVLDGLSLEMMIIKRERCSGPWGLLQLQLLYLPLAPEDSVSTPKNFEVQAVPVPSRPQPNLAVPPIVIRQ